jgi:iron complex transport system substrate-binding protein
VKGLPVARVALVAFMARMALAALAALGMLAGHPSAVAAPVSAVDDRGVTVNLAGPAQRVIALAPALTETVCALGACPRLVATDRHSNWPDSVRPLPKLGVLEDAQVEALVALKPDLVLLTASPRLATRLQSLGVAVAVLEPRNLADTRRVLARVATLLGDAAAAEPAWRALDERIEQAARRVPSPWRGQRAYVEVASTPHAAGEASFVGELLVRLGLRNMVPAALGPFPQLAPEAVLQAQPDLVVATRAAVASMGSRPGWRGLAALRQGRTCGLAPGPWDTLVRPGPRLGEAALALADCLEKLPPPDTAGAAAPPQGIPPGRGTP